ncbi:hypothetical protein GCM10009066_28370 [Halarchaeum salinum]|uniref:PIN domain-containing protein n=1 Tax=Halarchaeum salinum TaxID=489912 RepID=A0AAV3SBT1_9EURY
MTAIHIVDTSLFVAMGQPSNRRYLAVRTFARRNDITFVLPERVYDELTAEVDGVDTPPIDTAIEAGWTRVAAPLDYSLGLVSRMMDGVQRYIANADDRPADEIERAVPALAGVAAHAFVEGGCRPRVHLHDGFARWRRG